MMEMKKKRHHKVKTIKEIKENENEREPELKNTVERERGNSWQKKAKKTGPHAKSGKKKGVTKQNKKKKRKTKPLQRNQSEANYCRENRREPRSSNIDDSLSFSRKGKRKRNRTKKSAAGLNGK